MQRMSSWVVLVVLVAVLVATPSAWAQVDHRSVGLAWTTNLAAEQYLGINLFAVGPRGIGGFVEYRWSGNWDQRNAFYDNISVQMADGWGDEILGEQDQDGTFAGGVTWQLNRNVVGYAGLGFNKADQYQKRRDNTRILSSDGEYYIEASDGDLEISLTAGAIVRRRDFLVQLGLCSEPAGLVLGAGWAWPPRPEAGGR